MLPHSRIPLLFGLFAKPDSFRFCRLARVENLERSFPFHKIIFEEDASIIASSLSCPVLFEE